MKIYVDVTDSGGGGEHNEQSKIFLFPGYPA